MERLILMTVVLLGGCGFVVHGSPVALPDGTQGWSISCNGTGRDISDCMNEAARICHGKYNMLNGDETSTGGFASTAGNTVVAGRFIKRTLMVTCGS